MEISVYIIHNVLCYNLEIKTVVSSDCCEWLLPVQLTKSAADRQAFSQGLVHVIQGFLGEFFFL